MGIIRKDYILNRWVYYATSRSKRPREFKRTDVKEQTKTCFFCPSNEHLTPPEIGRVEYKEAWKMRWFLNKFPAVEKKGSARPKSKKFFLERDSYGIHEIIVETQHHKSQLADLPVQQIRELLEVCKVRIKELNKLKGIKYVEIFKNHGEDAGTSLVHSHTQVVALPQIPSLVTEEAKASIKNRKCLYCDIIKIEAKSKRKIFETKNVIAFAPFASRFNYEAWIFVKKHKKTMEELEENEIEDLALALKKILVKLKKINASYNFFIHYSPIGEDLHFHIEVTPRIATWGGFEISTDAVINSVLPEDAARFYRR
ncbi:galactose-1-phosphate uridylyltransferase [Candidatus Woesearchaeota archaeon]|nr:galactose-1-phosphate uridylyltransferase [Candidatus Woesearchaeota archaeon]